MNKPISSLEDKLLYKLIVQFLVYVQGVNHNLDSHLITVKQHLINNANPTILNDELANLSITIEQLLKAKSEAAYPNPIFNIHKDKCIYRIHELLENIKVPDKFLSQSKSIRSRLQDNLEDAAFENLIYSALNLIFDINTYVLSEQQETERFLEDISHQLRLLDQKTNLASHVTKTNHENRANLNIAIDRQIDHIKSSTSNASELKSLQHSINSNIQKLIAQLQQKKKYEDQHLNETQEQLNELSTKLRELESEAQTLRNNLKMAREQAYQDPVTCLPNRLAYNEKVTAEFNFFKRYKRPIALLIWDIDHFKRVNDLYGHKAGDKTLKLVAQILKQGCRETDFVARYGGEEFIMLLHYVNGAKAMIVAEKIRRVIASSEFNYQGKKVEITISCGICEFKEEYQSHEDIFEHADQALYLSKQNGRNQSNLFQN